MAVLALLVLGLTAAPALAPESSHAPAILSHPSEPQLQLDRGRFALPSVDYRAPDGTWKHGNGIIIGRDISPSTTVGIGFFRMRSKSQEVTNSPLARKSHKVSLGLSLRF